MKHILSLIVSLAWSVTLFAAITITPVSRTFDKDGGGGAILTAGTGEWTASTTADWITITPNTSGNAGESVVYIVNANLSADTRVGTIIVSGNTHTITQTGYDATIDPASATFDLNGGEGAVNVTTLSGISWTAKSNVDWIKLESTVGLGNGSVTYIVAKNDSVVTRTGTITLAGNTFSMTQTGVDVTLSPTSTKLESTAQVVLLTITALNTTSWTITPNVSWISVVSGGSGSGGGSATLAVAANPSWLERTGTVSVGTATLNVKQKGTTNLSFAITPETATAVSAGAYGNVAVVATPDAPWTALSETSWITLSSGQTGAGNGNIQYVVSPNTTLAERTGTIKITPPVAEPEIDLYSGLLFWIKDQTNIEGNELRQATYPLSKAFDGSFMNQLSGADISSPTNGFAISFSFKVGELSRLNRLFKWGNNRCLYIDEENVLCVGCAKWGGGWHIKKTTMVLRETDKWITVVLNQETLVSKMKIYGGDKNSPLSCVCSYVDNVGAAFGADDVQMDSFKLGYGNCPSEGYLQSGEVANLRFWNRALTEAECEAVDTMQDTMLEVKPKGVPSDTKYDFLSLNGNMYGSDETGAIACKATASGWTSCEGRGRLKYRALQSSGDGKITIDNFSNLFAGNYVLNNGRYLSEYAGGYAYISRLPDSYRQYGVNLPWACTATEDSEFDASYAFWVKTDSLSQQADSTLFKRLLRYHTDAAGNDVSTAAKNAEFGIYVTSDRKIKIEGSGITSWLSSNDIPLGEWVHICIVGVAEKSLCVFMNGTEIGTISSTMTLGYLPPVDRRYATDQTFGSVCLTNAYAEIGGWDGSIDEFQVYHKALSNVEVHQLYEAQIPARYYYHTITQSAATPSFVQTTVQVPANGGNASVTMTLTAGVNWTAKANSDWLTITDGTSGTGSATIAFTAGANPSVYERTGTLTVAGKTVKVVQAGWGAAVSYDESVVFGTDGGSDNVSVLAEANASWTATSDVDWISVVLGASGVGNGTVMYVVSPYNITTASRTGTLTVAGKKVYITQRGYEMSIDPYVAQIGSNSGTSLITVTAPVGAIWEAIAKESWITITGGQSGSGSGTITYSVKENTTGTVRTGTIIVAGEVYRVTQQCSLAVNVSVDGHGSVTGGGHYDAGTQVVLTAIPDDGYCFVGWTGDMVGNDNPCEVSVDSDKNITAVFMKLPAPTWSITYTNLKGATHANPATYQEETAFAFAVPTTGVTGYTFDKWVPAGITADMTGDQVVTANWTPNKYSLVFHANGGSGKMDALAMTYDAESAITSNAFVRTGYAFKGWATEADGAVVYADGATVSNLTAQAGGTVELYAVWQAASVPDPVITPVNGTVFTEASKTVSISCPLDGATIYYSTNGANPKASAKYRYTTPFVISATTTIRAFAVYGTKKSNLAVATITKKNLTLANVLNPDLMFTTGGDAVWMPIVDDTAKADEDSAKSGKIEDDQASWLETTVTGPGELSFWWKTDCEWDDWGDASYDHLVVYTDGDEVARLDGESDWEQIVLTFNNGVHTIRWAYEKDGDDYGGEDCAWLDKVVWTPSEAPSEPMPKIDDDATPKQVAEALEGSADAKLTECITNAATYNAYREWAESVKGASGDAAAGAQTVKDSPNAWVSFALGSDKLLEAPPTDEDLTVEAFEPTGEAGKFDFTVSVEGVEVGSDAQKENLKQVFGLEGAASLDSGAFSAGNVDLSFGTPKNGKVKFTAGPKDTNAGAFFMRVKINP